ncbi:MAG: ABC transporter ATP-binding protein [Pelagimonas sp.]|jgi:iron complex transport system ATP-binding protein|nr:ABC transporter ATP-binding protein [Pelagimonas sp.]
MITVQSLSYQIQGTQILKDISLSIAPGGITALIGPNGAGKSTLLHCLSGLQMIAGGQVRINNQDPLSMPDRDRARLVALLQQNPETVPRLSVRELVAFGRWPHHLGRPGKADHQAVDQALEVFDLTALADRSLDALSGGQRQRANVAMTWAQGTPWLFLDEPLNALDPRYARDLMERLHHLSRPSGDARSVVVVLHDINTAARWADHVVALKDGQLFDNGPAREVLSEEKLLALYETQFDVIETKGRFAVIPA